MSPDDLRFDRQLRHARGRIARLDHVRQWSLYAVHLIARRCLHGAPLPRADAAALAREAELLVGGVMTSEVDAALFHASALVLHVRRQLVSDEHERRALVQRARQLFEAALAATPAPATELRLDYALLELDDGEVARALVLLAGSDAPDVPGALRARLEASLVAATRRSA